MSTTCKIDTKTKERLEYAGKCMKIRKREEDSFYSSQYIINRLIQEYLDKIGIQPMPKETNEKGVESTEKYLERNRIDVNLKAVTKEKLRELSRKLYEKKIVDRKLNYNDIILLLYRKYLEPYPELAQELGLEFRYINNQIGMKELQDRIQKERFG